VKATWSESMLASRILSPSSDAASGSRKNTRSLFFDHFTVLGRQRNDAELEVDLRACRLGNQTQTQLGRLIRRGKNLLHGLNRVVGECVRPPPSC
jgi:hypothetical protein